MAIYELTTSATAPELTTSATAPIWETSTNVYKIENAYATDIWRNWSPNQINNYCFGPLNATSATNYITCDDNNIYTNYGAVTIGNWSTDFYNGPYIKYDGLNPIGEEENKKKMQFLWKMKTNLGIIVKSRVPESNRVESSERTALETLREIISESEFRKYLRYGFILIKGQSGNVYQIFRNKSHTRVWRNGKVIEEVCVRIKYDQNVPPTDNVIAFRQIIQTSETEFKKLGNVYKMAA
jgi:hypothetical protein